MKRHIAICIATYCRPKMLERLLNSLAQITVPEASEVQLRIVDNDTDQSAYPVVSNFKNSPKSFRDIQYAVEPDQNIAKARNRAVDMGPADMIAFIDDDEVVTPQWLVYLVDSLDSSNADAVFGPVEGRCPVGSPKWAHRGNFFNKKMPPLDQPLAWNGAKTSNALVRGKWFYKGNFRFDPAYGRSGGEDCNLFFRISQQGGRYVASSKACVWEDVEPNRTSVLWLCKRQYRNGLVFHRINVSNPSGRHPLTQFVIRLAKSIRYLAIGLPMMLAGRFEWTIRGLMTLALASGGLAAWLAPRHTNGFVEYQSRTSAQTTG